MIHIKGLRCLVVEDLEKMRKTIKLTLMQIGIRCDLRGFAYLCYAVEQVILNPNCLNNLCGELYVKIGQNFEVKNTMSVERSIRHAINTTQKSKTFSNLNKLFNAKLYKKNEKPTSGELISLVAKYCASETNVKVISA